MNQDYIDNFYKAAVNGKKGNLFTRVDALEKLLRKMQVGDVNNYITQVIEENKEIIIPSILGGVSDVTDPTFSGIVISPSGQMFDGILYSFAIVVDGVVVTGVGDDGATVIVGGTGDVISDVASSTVGNLVVMSGIDGKHVTDSGVTLISDANNNLAIGVGSQPNMDVDAYYNTSLGSNSLGSLTDGDSNTAIGFDALASLTGGQGNTAVGHSALGLATGQHNIGIGQAAGYYETGDYKLYIGDPGSTGIDEATARASTLLYGVMDAADPSLQSLTVNGDLIVTGSITGGSGLTHPQIMARVSLGF